MRTYPFHGGLTDLIPDKWVAGVTLLSGKSGNYYQASAWRLHADRANYDLVTSEVEFNTRGAACSAAESLAKSLNEGAPLPPAKRKLCQQCKGKGCYSGKVYSTSERQMVHSDAIPCVVPSCKKGYVDPQLSKEYSESWQNWGKPNS